MFDSIMLLSQAWKMNKSVSRFALKEGYLYILGPVGKKAANYIFFLILQVLQHMEDVKVREMQIFDYKKKIAEAETKLKQQQNLYEAVRSDRNLYSKNLIESQVKHISTASLFLNPFYLKKAFVMYKFELSYLSVHVLVMYIVYLF